MKTLIITFLLSTIGMASICKGQLNNSATSIRVHNLENAIAITGENKNVSYIFEGHKQYQITCLDSNGIETNNFIVNKNIRRKKDVILGATFSGNNYKVFFFNRKHNVLSSLTIEKNSKDYKYADLKTLPNNEFFLKGFSMNDKFYLLSVPKQKNILNVYSIAEGTDVKTETFGIEMTTFYATLNANNHLLSEPTETPVGIDVVNSVVYNNIRSCRSKKKMYYEDNKLVFAFDDPSTTHVVLVDLLKSKSYYKKLNFTLEEGNNSSSKSGNSFLYKNNLLRVTLSPVMMNLSVIALDSIYLRNSYNIFPDKDINILNSPIIQESSGYQISNEETVLHRTKQFFNRVINGNLTVAANKIDNDKLEIEIGSFEEIVVRNNSPFGGPGLTAGLGFGAGMYGSPYSYDPFSPFGGRPFGNSGYNSSGGLTTRQRIVYFKTLLSDSSFNHVKGDMPKTIKDSVNTFLKDQFKYDRPNILTITPVQDDRLLVGFYKRNRNKFETYYFSNLKANEIDY